MGWLDEVGLGGSEEFARRVDYLGLEAVEDLVRTMSSPSRANAVPRCRCAWWWEGRRVPRRRAPPPPRASALSGLSRVAAL